MPISLCRHCSVIMAFALTGAAVTESPAAPTDRLTDYSHRLPLRTMSSQAIVRLPLPRAVYLNARSSALHDLRVFDAVGASMPFALIDQAPPAVEKKATAPVAIFALYGTARDTGPMPESLQIRTRSDGAVISVTTPSRAASDELQSLILDLQPAALAAKVSAAAPVGALALSLPPGTDNYNAHVAVDVSNDLQDWDVLAEAAVSWLVNDRGASVGKHRIEFSPRPFRYARIRWLEGKPLAFADINADYVVQQYAAMQMETIVLPGLPAAEGRDVMYAAPVAIPAIAVGFVFEGQNVVMPVIVGQYQTTPNRKPGDRVVTRLQPIVNTTFYQLSQKGQQRVSGDVEIAPTNASIWVARPLTAILERPALRLRWAPATIVFVAAGKAPYQLAFGRASATAASVPLSQVAPGFTSRELAELESATPGALVQQQSPAAIVEADRTAGTRRYWLWGLLVCGLAALAAMAWHLFRQMKVDTSSPPSSDIAPDSGLHASE